MTVTGTRRHNDTYVTAEQTFPPEDADERTEVSNDSDDRKPPGAGVELPPTLDCGRYLLEEELGHGGVAKVVRAYDTRLRVYRAIKVIHTVDKDLGPSLRRRLENEAGAMAKASHPNVLPVHDFGEEGDYYYIVMDVAENGSVWDRIENGGAVRASQAIQWTIQTLAALAVAHDRGIVHRDVKPHNLMLDRYDRVLLGDFGIARVPHDRRTRSGVAMGSFAYMPPEQRVDAKKVGPQADIYAVGATLYHMLTADSPVDLFLVDTAPPRRWTKLHWELQRIIRRACSVRPADRYQTAGEMAEALRSIEHIDFSGSDTLFPAERVPPFSDHGDVRTPTLPGRVATSSVWPYFAFGMTVVLAAASVLGVILL